MSLLSSQLFKKCVIECVGTAILCLSVGFAAGTSEPLGGLGIGVTLMCAIYFGGHISGANYNPAVTLALLIRGVLSPLEFGMYVLAQLIGASFAACLTFPAVLDTAVAVTSSMPSVFSTGHLGHPAKGVDYTWTGALLAEVVITFALCHVVIHTATTTYSAGKSYCMHDGSSNPRLVSPPPRRI